jgi:hypothetical protein
LWHFYTLTGGLLEVRSTVAARQRRRRAASPARPSHEDWLTQRLESWELGSAIGTESSDFRNYFRLLVELYVVRHVDYFNMFFAELFLEVAEKRPQVLASDDKVEVSLLFESDSLSEVKEQIAHRKSIEISHTTFPRTLQFFRDSLKVNPEFDGGEVQRVKELIAIRNLIVHHDALITDRFLIETKWPKGRVGQRIVVSDDLLERHHQSSEEIATKLSDVIVSKFKL